MSGRTIAGLFDRLQNGLERRFVGREIRRESRLVADGGRHTRPSATPFERCGKLPTPHRIASEKLGAPTGRIMNSCMSTLLSA
jgi:hypothetical protein